MILIFFFQAEDGIRDRDVTGVQTCALPISVLDKVVRDQRLFLWVGSPADKPAFAGFQLAEQYGPGAYGLTVDSAGRIYTLATADGMELEHGAVGDSIGTRLGFRWAPSRNVLLAAGRRIAFGVATLRDAARRLGEKLEVHMDPNGNLLRIELLGADPVRVTGIVNSVV